MLAPLNDVSEIAQRSRNRPSIHLRHGFLRQHPLQISPQ